MRLKTVAKVGIFLRHAGRGEEHSQAGAGLSAAASLRWWTWNEIKYSSWHFLENAMAFLLSI